VPGEFGRRGSRHIRVPAKISSKVSCLTLREEKTEQGTGVAPAEPPAAYDRSCSRQRQQRAYQAPAVQNAPGQGRVILGGKAKLPFIDRNCR
jgi:hypothetical protein